MTGCLRPGNLVPSKTGKTRTTCDPRCRPAIRNVVSAQGCLISLLDLRGSVTLGDTVRFNGRLTGKLNVLWRGHVQVDSLRD